MVMADATGIDPNESNFKLLPKGWHEYEIIAYETKDGRQYPYESISQNGDPTVQLVCRAGDVLVFHNVAFIPKGKSGAGMWVHFLKCVGLPYEGKVNIPPSDFVGRKFMGYTIEDEYKGKRKNKITEVKSVEAVKDGGDDIPF